MNLKEFAEVKGVSPEAVRLAISDGRLKKSVKDVRKPGAKYAKWEIDPEKAKTEWKDNTDETKAFNVKKPPPDPLADLDDDDDQDDLTDISALMGLGTTPKTMKDAEKLEQIAKAQLAAIKLATLQGQLVPAEAVKAEAFKLARTVRDSVLNIPDRVAAEFAGLADAHTIHTRLHEEIRVALSALISEDA